MSEKIQHKVGDYVRVINYDGVFISSGDTGTISDIDVSDPDLPYCAKMDGIESFWWFRTDELESAAREWVLTIPEPPPASVTAVAPIDAPQRIYRRDSDDGYRWSTVEVVGSSFRGEMYSQEVTRSCDWNDVMRDWVRGVREVVE